ncbi:hypothetical protein TNCV_4749561 [Trichonephila clavipes]|nr:hypothetical protein TNCV_4749561 [Trichonephila clavipes]
MHSLIKKYDLRCIPLSNKRSPSVATVYLLVVVRGKISVKILASSGADTTQTGHNSNGNKSSGSDEPLLTLFQTTGRVFVWKTPAEVFHVDCLVPPVKHGEGSVMVWGLISSLRLRPPVVLERDDRM